MMRLVTALMGSHEVAVASPLESRIADEAKARAVPYYALPAVDLSLRMDAVETTAGLAHLARGASACTLKPDRRQGGSAGKAELNLIPCWARGRTTSTLASQRSRLARALRRRPAAERLPRGALGTAARSSALHLHRR